MDSQVDLLVSEIAGDWSSIHTVSIGNEFVLQGRKSAQQMVDLTRTARGLLRGKGYTGPVVSVNVFYEILQNPLLCEEQDYVACNTHPFFDNSVVAENAGGFVAEMRKQVSAACGGKYVMVTGKLNPVFNPI